MSKVFVSLLKTMALFMLMFLVLRVFFLVNYLSIISIEDIPFSELLRIFWYDIPLDISTACYLLALPALVFGLMSAFGRLRWARWLRWYFLLVIALYVVVVMGEIGIYGEWKTKLSYKALMYLREPSEVVNSVSTGKVIYLSLMFLIFTSLIYWIYVRWCEPKVGKGERRGSLWTHMVGLPLILFFLFYGIRGGLSAIPISTSSAYFSTYYFVNIVSVNPMYNLAENVSNGMLFDNNVSLHYMDSEVAARRTESVLRDECDSTQPLLKEGITPNIVVVLLESWSADLVESLGGEPGITPQFRELESGGVLFTDFYASGNRSQQGIAAIFSGLPAVPVTTITNHQEKYYACESLTKALDSVGYHSSFYFGGELNYGNILSFLKYLGFDVIVEQKNIKGDFNRGKLGIHDADMLSWYVEQLGDIPEPFFSTVFTLSSHSPYDNPRCTDIDLSWCSLEKDFIMSANYTDYALGLFMEQAQQQPWYDNTLFVFVADHSHNTYRNHWLNTFAYHKIPLLLYGEPLLDSVRGSQVDRIAGISDIPATLLAQLGLPHSQFRWSRDVMSHCYKPFAFFEMGEGVGWKTPEGEYIYSNQYGCDKNTLPQTLCDSITNDAKAYIQHWYEEFRSY